MSDDDLFARAMSVVRPIAKSDKADIKKPKPKRGLPGKLLRKRPSPVVIPPADHGHTAPEPAEEPWILKASGISREKLKQLAAGRPPVDIETDLHGMTRDEALSALEQMLESALDEKLRVLCIVHGRGLHSQGKPVLKEAVYQWFRSGPYASHILAAIPKPYTGGGSCLVLLRRNRSR
jgi:DNA-nicking Smr family endonuclease